MTRNPDLNENSAEAAIPVGINNAGGIAPQASSTIGVPAPPPETIEAVGCSQAYTCLNPFGPVDRMSEGAIVFDLPQLVYGQYLDIDQQFEITDDMSPGSVILQIPYHPISDYTNPYIKLYSKFHSRYNGDILFRMQLIGNATYSGTLMWFWYPTRYPSSIVTFAEAQKYEYKTQSVVMPSVEAFIHRDARQYGNYRDMRDGDIADRPHLVLCIHTTVVSPLREGIKVRMRVGSKLASKTDVLISRMPIRPFVLANPVLQEITPDNKVKSLNDLTMGEVFPYYSKRTLYGIIDGNTTLPGMSYLDGSGNIIDFSLHMASPALFGGDFPQSQYKRLFTSDTTYSTTGVNICRMVVILHQFDEATEKAIATDASFYAITETPNTWLARFKTAEAIQKYVAVDVIREQDANVIVWTNPDENTTVLKIMCQQYMVSRKGLILALAFQFESSSRDFDAAKHIGVPNNSSGVKLSYPFSPELGPVVHVGTLVTLPLPWFSFKFTDLPVTVVTTNDEVAPTTITSPTILEYFKIITQNTTAEQAFQFDLVDPTSKVRVMTLRFLPALGEFVINASDSIKYREYQGKITNLLIANAGNVPLATSMPLTDTSSWPKRFPATVSTISSYSSRSHFQPNAAAVAAAEALGVLGEASAISATESFFGNLMGRMGSGAISETSVAGATNPISRTSFIHNPTTTLFTSSDGFTRPISLPGKFSLRNIGTQPDASYTFSRGTSPDVIGTSEGTQVDFGRDASASDASTQSMGNLTSSRRTQTDPMEEPSVPTATYTTVSSPRSKFDLEPYYFATSLYDRLFGHSIPSNFDRFTYMSSRDAFKSNGAVVSGTFEEDMQANQNYWQGVQNGANRRFQHEQADRQYAHENDMQRNEFAQQQQMQSQTFAHDFDMQSRSFGQQSKMQSNEFDFKNQYQAKEFGQQKDMSNLNFEHDLALGSQKIGGALLNTATGGAFSLANSAVNKIGDIYMQNQAYKNNQSLMTQSFNQSLYASGASSQALKLAS